MEIMQIDQSATQKVCKTKIVQLEKSAAWKSDNSEIWREKKVHKNSALERTNV